MKKALTHISFPSLSAHPANLPAGRYVIYVLTAEPANVYLKFASNTPILVGKSGLTYKGSWNANTNSPTLASGVGVAGDYYIVSVAGTTTIDTINDWGINDWIIYNGTAWQKIDNSDLMGVETSQVIIENEATSDSTTFVSPRRFWQGIARFLALAWTFAAKITFTSAPRFSSTTASTLLSVDGTKDVGSATIGDKITFTSNTLNAVDYVSGNTIYVDRLSNFATNTRTGLSKYNRDRPFSTIQAAINAMATGDALVIKSGSYTENLTFTLASIYVFLYPNVTITGTITYSNADVQSDLRIIGSGATSLITNNTSTATITNGATGNSIRTCHLRLINVAVSNTNTGHAIASTGANNQLTIENNCIITSTTAAVINRYSTSSQSTCVLKDSTFSNTTGGFIRTNDEVSSSIFTVTNCNITTTGNLLVSVVQNGIQGKWKNCTITCARLFDWSGGSTNTRGDFAIINCYVNCTSTSTAFNCSPITGGTKLMLVGNTFISASSGNLLAFASVSVYGYNNTSNKTFPALTGGTNNNTDTNLDTDLI